MICSHLRRIFSVQQFSLLRSAPVLKFNSLCSTQVNASEIDDEDSECGDFSNFPISQSTVGKLLEHGIEKLFPVQYSTFNAIHNGSDVIVQARTGTGKTLAFALPLIESLKENDFMQRNRVPKVLTLVPTRELAVQIHKEVAKYKLPGMRSSCFYGGTSYERQELEIRSGIDFLVGTPGRIIDLVEKGLLDVSQLKHVVLDEADRMMDMGFQDSMEEILRHSYTESNKPQTLLFSATIPSWLKANSRKYLSNDPQTFDLIGSDTYRGATGVQHKAIQCGYYERASTIKDVMQLHSGMFGKTIIFTSTKHEANELALDSVINAESQVLHGDISQKQREITIQGFRNGKFNCLIATDVAARGLDIPEVDLVVQTEPPNDVDFYIHRAGRTGRAGKPGVCIIFYKPDQEYSLANVEQRAGIFFDRITPPKTSELINSSADDAVRLVEMVNEGVSEYFMNSARELIEKKGADEALAAALAHISGMTEISSRSMITSRRGFTTYIMYQNLVLRNPTPVWNILRRYFDDEFVGQVVSMRMCKDMKSCVFDIPTENVDVVKAIWRGDKFASLEQTTELPQLLQYSNEPYNANKKFSRNEQNNRGRRPNRYSRDYKPANRWR